MGLVRGVARTAVIAGTASAVSGRVQHKQQQKWAAQEEQQYMQQQAAMAQQQAAAAPPEDDTVAQLQQLARLRDQGILTEEEFAAKKKQILGI